MNLFDDSIASQYGAAVGAALFPGDDFFSLRQRQTVESLVNDMLVLGIEPTLVNLGDQLATFVPAGLRQAGGDSAGMRDWDRAKQEIFHALQAFFIDGGHQRRIAEQRATLAALELAGVQIDGRAALESRLQWAGDWRKHLVALAEQGRPHGIRLRAPDRDHTQHKTRQTLEEAGFSRSQIEALISGIDR